MPVRQYNNDKYYINNVNKQQKYDLNSTVQYLSKEIKIIQDRINHLEYNDIKKQKDIDLLIQQVKELRDENYYVKHKLHNLEQILLKVFNTEVEKPPKNKSSKIKKSKKEKQCILCQFNTNEDVIYNKKDKKYYHGSCLEEM